MKPTTYRCPENQITYYKRTPKNSRVKELTTLKISANYNIFRDLTPLKKYGVLQTSLIFIRGLMMFLGHWDSTVLAAKYALVNQISFLEVSYHSH